MSSKLPELLGCWREGGTQIHRGKMAMVGISRGRCHLNKSPLSPRQTWKTHTITRPQGHEAKDISGTFVDHMVPVPCPTLTPYGKGIRSVQEPQKR